MRILGSKDARVVENGHLIRLLFGANDDWVQADGDKHLEAIAPSEVRYRELADVTSQLETDVQVPLAVAGSVAEAYIAFETLEDRGADLTRADLLRKYLLVGQVSTCRFMQKTDGWMR